MYQAELKGNVNESWASKVARVNKLLEELGLVRAKDVMIGDSLHPGISGGQAKRVNIGIALVTEPRTETSQTISFLLSTRLRGRMTTNVTLKRVLRRGF